jgi:hypothetical protein
MDCLVDDADGLAINWQAAERCGYLPSSPAPEQTPKLEELTAPQLPFPIEYLRLIGSVHQAGATVNWQPRPKGSVGALTEKCLVSYRDGV